MREKWLQLESERNALIKKAEEIGKTREDYPSVGDWDTWHLHEVTMFDEGIYLEYEWGAYYEDRTWRTTVTWEELEKNEI